jgi:hypothetical protein
MPDLGEVIFDFTTMQATVAVHEIDRNLTAIYVVTGAVISFWFVFLEYLLFIQRDAILQFFESLPNHSD